MAEKKFVWQYVTILILALGIIYVATQSDSQNTVTVSGSAQRDVFPDEATVYLAVDTIAPTANASQEENARIANAVIAALEEAGAEDVETSSFSVYPEYDYGIYAASAPDSAVSPDFGERRTLRGYRTIHSLSAKTADVENVGALIDAASKAGANRVDSVQFSLSDEMTEQVRSELIAEAAGKARAKAQTLADAAGISLGKVISVSESSGGFYPVAARASYDAAESTKIEASDVTVSLDVSLTYALR